MTLFSTDISLILQQHDKVKSNISELPTNSQIQIDYVGANFGYIDDNTYIYGKSTNSILGKVFIWGNCNSENDIQLNKYCCIYLIDSNCYELVWYHNNTIVIYRNGVDWLRLEILDKKKIVWNIIKKDVYWGQLQSRAGITWDSLYIKHNRTGQKLPIFLDMDPGKEIPLTISNIVRLFLRKNAKLDNPILPYGNRGLSNEELEIYFIISIFTRYSLYGYYSRRHI